MKTRAIGLCLLGLVGGIAPARAVLQGKSGTAAVETRLPAYVANYLPFDPASKVTAEKAVDRLPGFQGYKVKRTGKYPKLAVERVVYVSDDGKWFFDGDTLSNPNPKPVGGASDLGWIESRTDAGQFAVGELLDFAQNHISRFSLALTLQPEHPT